MVKQGDIIKICLNPSAGHEQSGYRPTVVISNNLFHKKTNLAICCPISNTSNGFPLHIPLDERTTTTGYALCEHIRVLDVKSRTYNFVEKLPEDILHKIIDVVFAEIDYAED